MWFFISDVVCLKTWACWPGLLLKTIEHFDSYHNTVKVFLIRLLGVFAGVEVHFAKIFYKKEEELSRAFTEINSVNMNPSLRVAYMEVALSLTNHGSGICWLFDTNAWKEILSLCNEKQTVFIVRQTYKFAATFVWKLMFLGCSANVNTVLNHIIRPFTENDFMRLDSLSSEEEDVLCKTLEPMYQMLIAIISHEDHIKTPNCVVEFLVKDSKVITYCYIVLDRLRRKDICLLISKFLFWLTIAKMFYSKPMLPSIEYTKEDFMDLSVLYINTIHAHINRRCASLVFDYCNACNLIWASLNKTKQAMLEIDDKKFDFQKQLLVICLVPPMVYACNGNSYEAKIQDYISKIMNSPCEHTTRTAYALRDLMEQLDIQATTLQSVKRLTCLKDYLNNEQANLVFQSLFLILQEYNPIDYEGEMKVEQNSVDDQEKVLVMTYVLDTVLSLVKNYNINWQESFEVLCLYNVVFNVLKRSNLSCKVRH